MNETGATVLEPPAIEVLPSWLTLREASFLCGVDEATLLEWVRGALLRADRSLSKRLGDAYLLVASSDLRGMGALPDARGPVPAQAPVATAPRPPSTRPVVGRLSTQPPPVPEAPGLPRPPAGPAPSRLEPLPDSELARLEERWFRGAARCAAASFLVALAVALALPFSLGARPAVIRTSAMAPAVRRGDLVLTRDVPAADLRPGDAAMLTGARPPAAGVVDVAAMVAGNRVLVTTLSGERSTISASAPVSVVRYRVALIGRLALTLAGSPARIAATAVLAGGVLLGLARSRRSGRSRRNARPGSVPEDAPEA